MTYYSRRGNTKKIAKAIASEIRVKAENIKDVELKAEELIFLDPGCYGSKTGKPMTQFIKENDFKSRDIDLFGKMGGRRRRSK